MSWLRIIRDRKCSWSRPHNVERYAHVVRTEQLQIFFVLSMDDLNFLSLGLLGSKVDNQQNYKQRRHIIYEARSR